MAQASRIDGTCKRHIYNNNKEEQLGMVTIETKRGNFLTKFLFQISTKFTIMRIIDFVSLMTANAVFGIYANECSILIQSIQADQSNYRFRVGLKEDIYQELTSGWMCLLSG